MKQLAKYLLPLCCGIALASCYGLDKEEYRELAPITVSGLDRTIYAKATETLHLDKLRVESESGQDLVYEWSYGKPAGDFPGMVDTTFISSSPTLDYAFDKAGSYVLRLRIDNGESIGFHYYDLRVQAGFDEGFLILCNDDEGAGSLAFVKKRSPQEEAEGAQEIWDNLLTINPEYDFRSLRDVYVFSSPGYASGILISSGDDEGSIYRLDPVTLSVTYRMKGMDEYGVRTGQLLGERTSGTAHWALSEPLRRECAALRILDRHAHRAGNALPRTIRPAGTVRLENRRSARHPHVLRGRNHRIPQFENRGIRRTRRV